MLDASSHTRRIFIIGPMSDSTGKPLKNTRVVKDALETIFRGRKGERVRIDIPQGQYGINIPSDVFSAIDLSDLVVADISHRSPSVMYELAFAHALGIPTILIDAVDAPRPDLPLSSRKKVFYLGQERTLRPRSHSKRHIIDELEPIIDGWLKGDSDLGNDPLTRFYGIALVDISAVAGIALGYAENFIVPLVTAIQEQVAQSHQGKPVASPTAIVVVLPESLDNLREEELSVQKVLEAGSDGTRRLYQGLAAATLKGTRTVPFYVDGVFVDIPRTLIPLRRSRRVQRLLRVNHADWNLMERKLIDAFRRSLLKEAEARHDISQKLVHVVRQSELSTKISDLLSRA